MIKWFLTAIIFVHGLIHLIGVVSGLGIAKIEGFSGNTLIPLSGTLQTIFGVIWLIPVILFLIAATGLALNRQWWRMVAIGAAVISQILVIIWWPDAKFGTIANVLIVAGALLI